MFAFSNARWILSQVFAKWKILLRYLIEERFMDIASMVVKLQVFKVLHTKSASIGAHSGSVFFILTSPNIVQFWWSFWSDVILLQIKTEFETIFEKFKFLSKSFYSECRLFIHFWDQFTPRKQKILQKRKTLA